MDPLRTYVVIYPEVTNVNTGGAEDNPTLGDCRNQDITDPLICAFWGDGGGRFRSPGAFLIRRSVNLVTVVTDVFCSPGCRKPSPKERSLVLSPLIHCFH